KDDGVMTIDPSTYRVSAEAAWPPPPPTEDHKMVHQLDDVTRDSEAKATEMLDKLETINNFFMDAESGCGAINDGISANIELFGTLKEKFPNVAAFSEAFERNDALKSSVDEIIGNLQMGQDEIMMAMDMMQYQDIHRQKIERVINVMRALSKYMNTLFEGKIDDDKRVGSAVHIAGDTTTENLVSNDDIEALIESLGKK
ncbi:chemotaxis protein, partial [Campylobacter curvus]